jgi:hypothetical protein
MSITPELHAIEVRFTGTSATTISRINLNSFVIITEEATLTIPYNRSAGTWLDQAVEALRTKGFEIIGVAEGADCYYIISPTFKALMEE